MVFETGMGALENAAGKFAEKIADVLDVFDLSFFVSGSAAFGALLVWMSQQDNVPIPEDLSMDRALIGVIAAYILGLVSFAIGRAVREFVQLKISNAGKAEDEKSQHPLAELFVSHDLANVADFGNYKGKWSELYSRLWVLVRTEQSLRETYQLTRRYWVLGAAYDGLSVAAVLWILPVSGLDAPLWIRAILGAILLVAVGLSWRQAREYHRYQIGELAATAAYWQNLQSPKGSTVEKDQEPEESALENDGVDSE